MSESNGRKIKMTGRSGLIMKCALVLVFLLTIVLLIFGFREYFRVDRENVIVEGNIHYTTEQIKDIVLSNRFSDNSIFLSLQYRNKSITDLPFIERIDVSVVDHHTVKITVYEKSLAGYVKYLGSYMYFDKDGIVVESSNILTPGIPEVAGLNFNHVVLYEPLPVENMDIFRDILNITNLLKKHNLSATKLYFDSTYKVTLYFDGVRVALGDNPDLEYVIMGLVGILPHLPEKSGILHMENYSESNKDVTFEEDMR